MYTDKLLRVSDSQALGASGDTLATDVIDLLQFRELGQGAKLRAHVALVAQGSVSNLTAIAMNVNILMGTASNNTANATVVGALTPTPLTWMSGRPQIVEINPIVGPGTAASNSRYLFVRYNLNSSLATSASVITDIVCDIEGDRNFYPSGFQVT